MITEYQRIKKAFISNRSDDCLTHAGRFAELTLAIIKLIYDKIPLDINNIRFEPLFNDLTSRSKISAEDEIYLLAIPRACHAIYTIRNKKSVAHIKAIDPDLPDSVYAVATSDWVLSQLVMLNCTKNPKEISNFIHSLIDRKIPIIEEFEDGTMMVLKKDISFKDEVLITLYGLGKRVAKGDLLKLTNASYTQKLDTAVRTLVRERLIHTNATGIKITSLGQAYVDENYL